MDSRHIFFLISTNRLMNIHNSISGYPLIELWVSNIQAYYSWIAENRFMDIPKLNYGYPKNKL